MYSLRVVSKIPPPYLALSGTFDFLAISLHLLAVQTAAMSA